MAKKKKNKHIMYHRKLRPTSYSAQARDGIGARLIGWRKHYYGNDFYEVIKAACNSNRCNIVKHRMIKGLRRYGKRKGLI